MSKFPLLNGFFSIDKDRNYQLSASRHSAGYSSSHSLMFAGGGVIILCNKTNKL